MISNQQHQQFYSWQTQVQEEEWTKYTQTTMHILWKNKQLFAGRIWGYESGSGNLILRFKTEMIPRMKSFYCLCLVGQAAGENPALWTFTYQAFRLSEALSSKNSECRTEFFLKTDEPGCRYIGVTGVAAAFVQEVKEKYLDNHLHPIIVLAEKDPPLQYLSNLGNYVQSRPEHPLLQLTIGQGPSNWRPAALDNQQDVLPNILAHFETADQLVLQGPPGTGKSFLVAQVCAHYARMGNTIAVSALTNKALMEVAEKEGLHEALDQGRVYKTSLSSDEQKLLPKLQNASDNTPGQGEILLATYYKLSEKINEPTLKKRLDFLVIEEASQAYLATIVSFMDLAKKVLIVGDHQQLPPVVLKQEEVQQISPQINSIINGLETYAINHEGQSKRLTKTRRLSAASAKLTGIFYDNQLESIANYDPAKGYTGIYDQLFDADGGISLVKLPLLAKDYNQQALLPLLVKIALDILATDKHTEVALLSPYIEVEKSLYHTYSHYSSNFSRTTISTIHKIQGLTTDYTLLYLPLNNPGFDLDGQLFNVATSRARKGTLIITNKSIELISKQSVEVRRFLSSLRDITETFLPLLAKST